MIEVAPDGSEPVVTVTRMFDASPERVFDAWTSASQLAKWFGPSECVVDEVVCDLKVGGEYAITLILPTGDRARQSGIYKKIDRPVSLVFTWVLADQPCEGSEGAHAETLVSLDFRPVGAGTELTLTHEGLPTDAAKVAHMQGWVGSLASLAEFVEGRGGVGKT